MTDLQRGGTPLRVVRWSRWLRRIDVEPVVGCLAGPGPLSDELGRLGVAHFTCGARHPLDATALVRLARHIRRFNPDLIHSSLFHANLAARFVGRLDRRRPIVTNTVTVEVERIWHRRLEQLTARLSDAHVCNAPAVARDVVRKLGFPAHRVVIIPNGVDLDAMDATPPMERAPLGIPEGAALLVWVGRMDPVKDLISWIDVFD
ncbi:MAG: glycosyltransferase, partial [Phycisphaerae bacterium]